MQCAKAEPSSHPEHSKDIVSRSVSIPCNRFFLFLPIIQSIAVFVAHSIFPTPGLYPRTAMDDADNAVTAVKRHISHLFEALRQIRFCQRSTERECAVPDALQSLRQMHGSQRHAHRKCVTPYTFHIAQPYYILERHASVKCIAANTDYNSVLKDGMAISSDDGVPQNR